MCMYKVFVNVYRQISSMAQLVRDQSSNQGGGIESRCGEEFFMLFFSRASQLESANTNEINRD